MMDFIMVPAVMAIITLGVYKLFELFVCKKERLAIIEKMGDKLTPDLLDHRISFSSVGNFSFSSLKIGCLMLGLGLGLLVGYLISTCYIPVYMNDGNFYEYRTVLGLIYGSCFLLFGGVGLIAAFVVELKLGRK